MLGMEKDTFVIDLAKKRGFNLGSSAGNKDVQVFLDSLGVNPDIDYRSQRFICIHGIEWGVGKDFGFKVVDLTERTNAGKKRLGKGG